MESLFEKEIKIIDNKCFWDDYKLEAMKRDAYLKEDFHVVQNSIMAKSFMIFEVNIYVPDRCMKYYMQGQTASSMAVKWISFCVDDSIFWCRSWTGYIVYRAQFIQEGDNYRIIKLFVNNDPKQVDCNYFKLSNKNDIIFDFLLLLHPGKAIVPSMHMLGFENKMICLAKEYAYDSIENADDLPEVVESVIDNFMCGVSWVCENYATFPTPWNEEFFQSKLDVAVENYLADYLKEIEWVEPVSEDDIQNFKDSLCLDFKSGAIKAVECVKYIHLPENETIDNFLGEGTIFASIK